jgi:hypothetical protein
MRNDDSDGGSEVPTTPEAIRDAFTEGGVPFVDDVDPRDRELARVRWPPAVVGDRIPDRHYQGAAAVQVDVPRWVLATAAYRLEAAAADGLESRSDARFQVVDAFAEAVNLDVTYRTPSGADAVEAVLEAVDVSGAGSGTDTGTGSDE